ncbi:MAG: pteridine-dependent deoxygenase, partial [Acidobacteriota bacterium]
RAGRPVENPRQRPAYRYSPRYGPLPPCFARATIVDAPSTAAGNDDPRAWLLVGGTASVRGELSVHEGDLGAQLEETFHNLDHLLRAAVAETGARGGRYVDLRVYHLDPVAAPPLRAAVHSAYPTLEGLETVRADICRRELLVEIEGVARLDR